MMRSVIALWPHPAQSVVLPPRYATGSSPMRLTFFPGAGCCVGVDMDSPLRRTRKIDSVLVPCALGLGPWALGLGPWALGLGPWALGLGPCALGLGPCALRLGPWA